MNRTEERPVGDVSAPARPRPRRRWLLAALTAAVLAGATAIGVVTGAAPAPPAEPAPSTADPLGAQIATLQEHLRSNPHDADAWATLGLEYVQQARNTVNPMYYPKADGALGTSLRLQPTGNAAGLTGTAALRAAQHRFAEALDLARQASTLEPDDSTPYGVAADALTQLGRYDEARAAVQQMLDLRPGTPAFTRAAYVYELTGDVAAARDLMNQALDAAGSPADVAFCRYHLAELAFSGGDPTEALRQIQLGAAADPRNPDLLAGQARAEAALGRTEAAAHWAEVVATVPSPQYLLEAGDFFSSTGRTTQAEQAYRLFEAQNALFAANGIVPDTDVTLFHADHGDPATALRSAEAGTAIRPFLEMDDAYAWALHVNGRDAEALAWSDKAMATGLRSALFSFHRGMIEKSLGNRDAARTHLTAAFAINMHFNPVQAPVGRAALAELGGPR